MVFRLNIYASGSRDEIMIAFFETFIMILCFFRRVKKAFSGQNNTFSDHWIELHTGLKIWNRAHLTGRGGRAGTGTECRHGYRGTRATLHYLPPFSGLSGGG